MVQRLTIRYIVRLVLGSQDQPETLHLHQKKWTDRVGTPACTGFFRLADPQSVRFVEAFDPARARTRYRLCRRRFAHRACRIADLRAHRQLVGLHQFAPTPDWLMLRLPRRSGYLFRRVRVVAQGVSMLKGSRLPVYLGHPRMCDVMWEVGLKSVLGQTTNLVR